LEARPVVCIQKIQSHKHVFPAANWGAADVAAGVPGVAGVQAGREKRKKAKSQAFMQAEGGWLAPQFMPKIQLLFLGLIRHALPIQVPFHLLLFT
jgi:hypothetical protein